MKDVQSTGDQPGCRWVNGSACSLLTCEKKPVIVPGATHLFEEPGTLEQVAEHAGRMVSTLFAVVLQMRFNNAPISLSSAMVAMTDAELLEELERQFDESGDVPFFIAIPTYRGSANSA